jgi:glycosyltransferase involved in cell wall biosynthesis
VKIHALAHSLRYTGASLALYRLLLELAPRHQITVQTGDRDGPVRAGLEAAGVRITEEREAIAPDVVLANAMLASKVLRGFAARVPVVWWIHEALAGLRWIQDGHVDIQAFREATTVVFVSDWQPRSVFGPWVRGEHWTVVRHGVRPDPPSLPAPFRKKAGHLYLLHLGSVNHLKGQDLTLKALQLLSDPRVHVFFVGGRTGEGKYLADVGNSDTVTFTGALPEEQAQAYLQHCDALVFPSRDEGFGLVALEAMVRGTCVLASDLGSLTDVVRHGRTGLVSPVDDFRVLAGNIAMVRNDPELRATLATNGRRLVRRDFDWEVHVRRMTRVLEEAAR